MSDNGQIVVFTHHLKHRIDLHVSHFFCDLLHYYHIELLHLNPNSILQIAILLTFVRHSLEFLPSSL
jgi:hypothetical protein